MTTEERLVKLIQYFKQHQNDSESMKRIIAMQGHDGLFSVCFGNSRFTEEAVETIARTFRYSITWIMNPHLVKAPLVGVDYVEALERRKKNSHVKMYRWVRRGGPHIEETYV